MLTQINGKALETDPYTEQITEMQQQALQVVSYDHLNELTRVQDHQDFLLKLLTSKDSFVRKKIIEQNLSYLNQRLTHYLDRIGLPHTVKFMNDLTVSIEEAFLSICKLVSPKNSSDLNELALIISLV